jgi:hypothetical protein
MKGWRICRARGQTAPSKQFESFGGRGWRRPERTIARQTSAQNTPRVEKRAHATIARTCGKEPNFPKKNAKLMDKSNRMSCDIYQAMCGAGIGRQKVAHHLRSARLPLGGRAAGDHTNAAPSPGGTPIH